MADIASAKMINPSTFDFLKQLRENNHREWFEQNKHQYEEAKQNFHDFIQYMIHEISFFDNTIPRDMDAKHCILRMNRDVRFSDDKSPYRTNFSAYIVRGGKKSPYVGYHVQVEPDGKSFFGGGIHKPTPAQLNAIRQEIVYDTEEFRRVFNYSKSYFPFFQGGDMLKTAPRNYPKNHPAIKYLKYKNFVLEYKIRDEYLLNKYSMTSLAHMLYGFKRLTDFINKALTPI